VTSWYERHTTLADSASLDAGSPATADVSGYRSPTVLVTPESIGGTDDTVTIRAVGAAGTYRIDQRTVSSTDGSDDYTVGVPQCETVEFESSNGDTYSAEVRETHG
jgi:hypothetical protein